MKLPVIQLERQIEKDRNNNVEQNSMKIEIEVEEVELKYSHLISTYQHMIIQR